MINPYESPQTEVHVETHSQAMVAIGLTGFFPFAILTFGNQAAIFWGLEGFQYWKAPWYLALFCKLSVISILISVVMAAIVAKPVRLRTKEYQWIGVVLTFFAGVPPLLVFLLYPLVQYTVKHDLLFPIAILLVVSQSVLLAFSSVRYLDRWWVFVACGIVCSSSGVVLAIYQIMVCSLVT